MPNKPSRSIIDSIVGDIRPSLASSRSLVIMLLAGDYGDVPPAQRQQLELLLKLDDQMLNALNGWSDSERLWRGQIMIESEPCNLGEVLSGLPGELPQRRSWPLILGDKKRLRQLFARLCDDHTVLRCRVRANDCVVTVVDATATSRHSRERLRTSINVQVAQLFAELHHGSITIDSHAQRGIVFHVRLPLARQMSFFEEA